jgi:hypothetical protein
LSTDNRHELIRQIARVRQPCVVHQRGDDA